LLNLFLSDAAREVYTRLHVRAHLFRDRRSHGAGPVGRPLPHHMPRPVGLLPASPRTPLLTRSRTLD
jgi:hypothetical protein